MWSRSFSHCSNKRVDLTAVLILPIRIRDHRGPVTTKHVLQKSRIFPMNVIIRQTIKKCVLT